MITFVIRRLLLLIPLLVAVSVLSFGIMVMAPGNYVDTLRQNPQIKAETIKRFEINYGFKDKNGKSISAPRRYLRWLLGGEKPEGGFACGALCGNLGESMEFHQPVLGLIAPRAYATFLLALCATIFASQSRR